MVERENKRDNKKEAGSVEIEYYTDPLCCWSWSLEPQWRRLRFEYSGKVKWRYRMGGLIANWESFNDPMNVVNRPLQMGPLWMEAKYVSGMPIRDKIWYENPPASSFPACIAVKAAGLQSPVASEAYLRKVREAVMLQGQNIGGRDVLRQVGRSLAEAQPDVFNAEVFERDLGGEEARKAFEEDLRQVRLHGITRFPTLTIRREGGDHGVLLIGYRPYVALRTALYQVAPELEPVQHTTDESEYRRYWGSITERELEEVLKGTVS
ncbi:DsbA family protein [Pontibacter virosus]|uniref:Putative DsbA family dithiol-disulfide isomerase n=1 Tax=Pontibacter virosus TaxID=1765052 RepID=A0A2U1B4U2_9BACT|nr:DsbA family protein [Pontibacter virosus]PVY43706.1 putative DsbA family dithiol-disulfide isomerase [Pontibacter virosus]